MLIPLVENSSTAATKSEDEVHNNVAAVNSCSSNELDSLISAFTSPVPSHILTDYENKKKKKMTVIQT